MRPKRARRTGFGQGAPSIRTAVLGAWPRKFTGASTLTVVLLFILATFAVLQFRMIERRVHYR
jgi:hypothetical protein